MKLAEKVRESLTILVIVGTSTDEHYLKSQVGMECESDCLFGQSDRILWSSDFFSLTHTQVVSSSYDRLLVQMRVAIW